MGRQRRAVKGRRHTPRQFIMQGKRLPERPSPTRSRVAINVVIVISESATHIPSEARDLLQCDNFANKTFTIRDRQTLTFLFVD
jgi:hypothetical protein